MLKLYLTIDSSTVGKCHEPVANRLFFTYSFTNLSQMEVLWIFLRLESF
jgi:hypothetical protein